MLKPGNFDHRRMSGSCTPETSDAQRLGVLLVNLGTPDAPTTPAVRRFLAQFLWDPRVVEAPRWSWWLALHGFILRFRPARSAHAYRQIWTDGGSPLLLHSRALADGVRGALADSGSPGSESAHSTPADRGSAGGAPRRSAENGSACAASVAHSVALGMSYGSPSIPEALAQLRKDGARRLVVLPLYPQYSGTTTGSVFDRVSRELQRWRRVPELHFIADYHDEPAYIEALGASIEQHWRARGRAHLLFSFHGLPQRYARAGDPYQDQCLGTARAVAQRLALGEDEWSVGFQSRVGREEWLRPYTDELLIQYARQGRRRISVVCPGFAADCLETLEEIAIRNRASFIAHGGESCEYIPALNAGAAHVALLVDLIRRHAGARSGDVHSPAATGAVEARVPRTDTAPDAAR